MSDRETRLRNLLIEQGIFSPREKLTISVVEHEGEIHRKSEAQTRRYFVAKDDVPHYAVKYFPATWKFPPKTIVETMKRYQKLDSVKVPGLVATFESGEGVYIVEEFLRDAVTLETLVKDGSVGVNEAVGLLRGIFTELYETGSKPSGEKIRAEKQSFLDALRAYIRPGAFGETMLSYVDRVIDDHASEYRTILSTGDIIDRNLVHAHGAWHLIDFEYCHETIFGFTDAYRNILYTSWARYFSLGELYPPLKNFPVDVAAMLSLAWEYHFQGSVLDEESLAQTRRHLRYMFWSAVEPSALYALDRRVGEVESLISLRDSEIAQARGEAADHSARAAGAEQSSRNLESLVRQKDEELSSLKGRIKQQETLASELDRVLAQQRADIGQLHSQLLTQQQLLLERDRQVQRFTDELRVRDERHAAQSAELANHKAELTQKDEKLRSLLEEVSALRESLQAGERLFAAQKAALEEKLAHSQLELDSRQNRISQLTNWADDLQHQIRVHGDRVTAQKARLDEITSRLQSTEEQLSEKTRLYLQKSADYIYIKSTLSYSFGRILTLPLVLLFELCLFLYKALDRALGRILWPQGSKRYLLVNALVNIRQSIATGTYLLRMHGVGGLWNGIKQTWESGVGLGIYKNLETPVVATPMVPPSKVQLLQVREEHLDAGTGISVVIPVLNGASHLSSLLPALLDQRGFAPIELIVVDSGSTDESVEIARNCGANVISIPPAEFSHSGTRNLGASKATQPYLLVMTQDALPTSNRWMYEMFKALTEYKVAAVSCKELPRSDSDLFSRVQMWNHYKYYLNVDVGDKILSLPDTTDPDLLRRHAQLSDVACMMPLSIHQSYKYRYDYGEDLDLGVRLIRDGKKIAILGSTAVIHSHTRDPYHHLKRGYIDKLIVSKILGETIPDSKTSLDTVLRDILLSFEVIASSDVSRALSNRSNISVGELRDVYFRNINKHSTQQDPGLVRIAEHPAVDAQFLAFLKRVQKMYKKEKSKQAEQSIMLRTMGHFDELTFRYMKESYETIDETIVRDFIGSNMKSFANLCGVFLAIAVVSKADGGSRMKDISLELGDGKNVRVPQGQSAG